MMNWNAFITVTFTIIAILFVSKRFPSIHPSLHPFLLPSWSHSCTYVPTTRQMPHTHSSLPNQSNSNSSTKVESQSHLQSQSQSHFVAEGRTYSHAVNHGNVEGTHENCESMGEEFGNNLESMSIDDGENI